MNLTMLGAMKGDVVLNFNQLENAYQYEIKPAIEYFSKQQKGDENYWQSKHMLNSGISNFINCYLGSLKEACKGAPVYSIVNSRFFKKMIESVELARFEMDIGIDKHGLAIESLLKLYINLCKLKPATKEQCDPLLLELFKTAGHVTPISQSTYAVESLCETAEKMIYTAINISKVKEEDLTVLKVITADIFNYMKKYLPEV
jgi:hypothetical protein